MGRFGQIVLTLLAAVSAAALQACATSGAGMTSAISVPPEGILQPTTGGSPEHLPDLPPDAAGQGGVLIGYFKSHRLPMVWASVVDGKGRRQVILYGFVATPFGKAYAERATRRIFHNPRVVVSNRILMVPAVIRANESAGGGGSSGANASNADMPVILATLDSYVTQEEVSPYDQSVQQRRRGWLEDWYLLIPPVNWITMRRDHFAPLGRWEDLGTFSRVENCEKIRTAALENVCKERLNACENLAYTLLCVPTDDPRLRLFRSDY